MSEEKVKEDPVKLHKGNKVKPSDSFIAFIASSPWSGLATKTARARVIGFVTFIG